MKSCCQYMGCRYETDWVNIILAVIYTVKGTLCHITYYSSVSLAKKQTIVMVNFQKFQTRLFWSQIKFGYQGWNSQNACQDSKQGRS